MGSIPGASVEYACVCVCVCGGGGGNICTSYETFATFLNSHLSFVLIIMKSLSVCLFACLHDCLSLSLSLKITFIFVQFEYVL